MKSIKTVIFYVAVWLAAIPASVSAAAPGDESGAPRERLSLNDGWDFHFGKPGDLGEDRYLNKAVGFSGKGIHGKDGTLRLPHDWAAALAPNPKGYPPNAFKPLGFQFPETSIGWYGRTFTVPASDAGRRFWLEFDGVYRESQVWINGHYCGRHEGGYDSFRYDVTDLVEPGQKNDIAVRVDASQHEGWWYEGAGIYRNVWLLKTGPVAIAPDGVFVRTEFKDNVPQEQARVLVEARVCNQAEPAQQIQVRCRVLDAQGRAVAESVGPLAVAGVADAIIKLDLKVSKPALWSPESPAMYTLETTVNRGGKICDRLQTPFGFRTIKFDANRGFLLNGQPTLIKGVCLHQDYPGVGTAMPRALHTWRLKVLRSIGVNAIRMSHNPADPVLLDLCDQMGFLVMAETRPFLSTPYGLNQLQGLIQRDRNHPSIIIWSVGNEEADQNKPAGKRTARTLVREVRKLDPTRPTTFANNGSDKYEGVNSEVDVHGWNYGNPKQWQDYHAAHPEQPTLITEYYTGRGTRSLYFVEKGSAYRSAYGLAAWWREVVANPWLSGMFIWTGFDYGGEPDGKASWPIVHNSFGIVDRCGFRKDNAYYYEAQWSGRPVLHLLPHWTWPDRVGQPIDVRAYTNCDAVELFLNGRSLGKGKVTRGGWQEYIGWKVNYEPGMLEARGYKDGKLILRDKVETAGAPAALRLSVDRPAIAADGDDMAIVNVAVVDEKGRVAPRANLPVTFKIEGVETLAGVGNGDPAWHGPEQDAQVPCFNGLAQALVRSTQSAGTIRLTVDSPGLLGSEAKVQTRKPADIR